MRIGIDGNEANVEKKVGVSVYTLELLRHFRIRANEALEFRIFLRTSPMMHMPKATPHFTYEVVKGPFLWTQFFLPLRLILKKNIDVFFSPAHYSPRFSPVPLVVTIHDLAFFYYPQEFLKEDLYKLRHWSGQSLKNARRVIAVSKNTKKDIVKFYNVPSEKIEVVYNGYEKPTSPKRLPNHPDRPYFLFTGTLQPRKNVPFLVRAFRAFHENNPAFRLVLAGKRGWLYDEIFAEIKKSGVERFIILAGYVTDHELISLYKNAHAFIMPSLYEGFGVPLLEAMSFGCPVISSFVSSLPEVGGDACLYFDPRNERDLTEKMDLIGKNEALRKELVAKGFDRVKLFSWKKCAEDTLRVIKSSAL